MPGLRAFVPADIPAVVRLRRRAFRFSGWKSDDDLAAYFRTVFFDNPWYTPDLPSVVYDTGKEVVGFLGVLPRPFRMGDRQLQAVVTTQFMVAPEHRGLIGARILDRVFHGPQDITYADVANEAAQRPWEALGGSAVPIYCIHWSSSLRKTRDAMNSSKSLSAKVVRKGLKPALIAIDEVRGKLGAAPRAADGYVENIDLTRLPGYMMEIAGEALHPEYNEAALAWLSNRMRQNWSEGRFASAIVRESDGALAGIFTYVLQPDGLAQVLQLFAKNRQAAQRVVPHLLKHAYDAGAIRLSGRIEQRCVQQLVAQHCALEYRRQLVLFHAKQTALLNHVLRGEALLSGLDGEWWMMF